MNKNSVDNFDEIEEDTMKGKFLTFSLGKEFYGIEISYVTEIIGIQKITVVPELPNFVKGIINLRGSIIPVMDARDKFGKEEIEYNDRTCIVVIDVYDTSLGIIVDEVSEVLNMDEENIVKPPTIIDGDKRFVKNIGKNNDTVIMIIDCEKLVVQEEVESLLKINE